MDELTLLHDYEKELHGLKTQNASLLEALKVFFKVVVVDGEQYRPGYPLCEGCEDLTIARGWECFYKKQTTECKYPDDLRKKAIASLNGEENDAT